MTEQKGVILVTGGAGFIGSNLCEALLRKGNNVICIDNFDNYYRPKIKKSNIKGLLKNKNFKFYKTDILNKQKLDKVFKKHKINKIIHLAARGGVTSSFKNPQFCNKTNVLGTLNLLELAREFKIDNFIFASSSSVYGITTKIPFSEKDVGGKIISPYAISKRNAELYCKIYSEMYGLNVTCLRFFTVYGPRNRPDMAIYKFVDKINRGKPIPTYGSGNSKRDYIYIDDLLEGILLTLDKNFRFEIINLGNSNPIKLNYLINLIEKNLGKKAKVRELSTRKGDIPITYANISKAKELLFWEPKIKIEEGIKRFINWYKNEI